jgi:hypothetical protein
VDNVVVSEADSVPDVANLLEFKPSSAEDAANPNIYGNHLDKESLLKTGNNVTADYLEKEPKPYQENYDYRSYREDYTDSEVERERDCERDSYQERMSGSHTDSYEGRTQGYLGSYHRIRHMSGLSEGQPYPPNYSVGTYPHGAYRSGDSYSGSYGSPEHSGIYPPNEGPEQYGSRYSQEGVGLTSMAPLDPEQRTDAKQVSGILKRASGHEVGVEDTNDEEESAYNEHFKNASHGGSVPGEYRVPSVRVRPVQALYTAQQTDFAGTASQQGKQDGNGKKSPYLEREVILPRELSATWDQGDQGDQADQAQPGAEPAMRQGISVERLDRLQLEMNPPVDRWNLMYLTLILHGVGTLMPWNIFINAKTVSYVSVT